jgi:hypothetical protein
MAQGDGNLYNNFREQVMEGVFNLASGGHTLKVTLHTGYTPDIDAHTVWADVSGTEYSTAGNYTAGGATLGSQDVTQDNDNDRGVFDAADVTWTSLGPLSPATPSHAILWDDTPSSPEDPLIAYWELGTTATNGGNYTLAWGTDGIILLT